MSGIVFYDTYNDGGFPPLKFVNKVYPPLAGAARDRYHELLKLWPDKFRDGEERREIVKIGWDFGFGEGAIAEDAAALPWLPQKLADLRARRGALVPMREQQQKFVQQVTTAESALLGCKAGNYAELAHRWAAAEANFVQLSQKLSSLETSLRSEWGEVYRAHARLIDPPELD
jgi:hypothetical protein